MKQFPVTSRRFSTSVLFVLFVLSLITRIQAGSVIRLYYDGVSTSSDPTSFRTSLASLTNSPIFPDGPTFEEQLDDFRALANSPLKPGLQGKDDSGVDFGSYIRGYLEAPTTGSYLFDIASSDQSALYLSTDVTSDNKQLIAYEPQSGDPLFGGANQQTRLSAPISLVRGQKYYFEVLHKQGGSAGYIQVGWQRPDGVQEIIPALHLAQYPVDPFLGTGDLNQAPIFNSKGLNAGNLPTSLALNEGDPLLLQLDVVAGQPTTFTWTSNNVVLAGEILSYYSLKHASATLNGTKFSASVVNSGGALTSSVVTVSVVPDRTPPTVLSADTAGNPNLLSITFSKPLDPISATQSANYQISSIGGPTIPIKSIQVLGDERTVQLSVSQPFASGGQYLVVVQNIRDQAFLPNVISPNPTQVPFTLSAASGTTYTFDSGNPSGFAFYGNAYVSPAGSYDSSGYLVLTDAKQSQNGAVVLTDRHDIDQVHIRFKTRIGDGRSITGTDLPGDGFSLNIAADLPQGTLSSPDTGYRPDVPGNRLTVYFNSHPHSALDVPSIGVLLNNVVITNIPTGTNGVPPITADDGHWASVDLQVLRSGLLSLNWDGVQVIDGLATAWEGVSSAQIGLAARTEGFWLQTHWFDDLYINLSEGNVGAVALDPSSVLSGTFLEGSTVRLAAVPTGAGPLFYQWFKNGLPLNGENNRILTFPAQVGSGGNFSLNVSNTFSSFTSPAQPVVILPDLTPPAVITIRGVAGGVNSVTLALSKPLDPATATDLSTYSSPLFNILSALLLADGQTVVLKTTQQRVGVIYPLTIHGLKDLTAAGNQLSATLQFQSELTYADEVLADNPARYFQFNETSGTVAFTLTSLGDQQNTNGVYQNPPVALGVPPLIPSAGPNDYAVQFDSSVTNWLNIPNGGDLNDYRGPWPQKTFEFWFNANQLPGSLPLPPNPSQADLLYNSTVGLYEEGGSLRGVGFYLWHDPSSSDSSHAQFIFHAYNSTTDGPGAPFGLLQYAPAFIQTTVTTNQTYHVVGVFDGRISDRSGELRLYINGQLVGRAPGVGQIYNHNGDIRVGNGQNRNHLSQYGNWGNFDGVIDDLSLYNTVLSDDRILAHHRAATGESLVVTNPPVSISSVDAHGNPYQLSVVFNQPVSRQTATILSHYILSDSHGARLSLQKAILLDDLITVQLTGSFQFGVGNAYTLQASGVADLLAPSNQLPASSVPFTFVSDGPASIASSSNLGDRQVIENEEVQFAVTATGQQPFHYQWNFNGSPIPGATAASLSFSAPLTAAGNYSVTVANDFSSVTSPISKLTVIPDTIPPQWIGLKGLAGTLNQIRLTFSKPVDPTSGTNLATYSIPSSSVSGLKILSASLSPDGTGVWLQTTAQTDGQTNTVSITGLLDRAARPNSLSASATFVSGISYRDEIIGDGAVRYWTFAETNGTDFHTLVSKFDTSAENLVGQLINNPVLDVPGLVPNLGNDPAIAFSGNSLSNHIALPNARDLNAILGPWPKRTHLFSFRADHLPRVNGTNVESPAIFAHDIVAFYLYGTQDTNNPTEALLAFRAHNTSSDGPGTPWGGTTLATSKHVLVPIKAGQVYHVAGVIDGSVNFTGQLLLYVNGQLVGAVGGIGQLYKHPNTPPTIGQGSFTTHVGYSQNLDITTPNYNARFDGVIDEFSILNKALSPSRIAQLYQFALTPNREAALLPIEPTQLGVGWDGTHIILNWEGTGTLESADSLIGPFTPVPNATSPYSTTLTSTGRRFYRVVTQ